MTTGITGFPGRLASCRKHPRSGYCGEPFRIVGIDPVSLEWHPIFWHDATTGIGFTSVALETFDGRIFLGSATGDRIAQLSLGRGQACSP